MGGAVVGLVIAAGAPIIVTVTVGVMIGGGYGVTGMCVGEEIDRRREDRPYHVSLSEVLLTFAVGGIPGPAGLVTGATISGLERMNKELIAQPSGTGSAGSDSTSYRTRTTPSGLPASFPRADLRY